VFLNSFLDLGVSSFYTRYHSCRFYSPHFFLLIFALLPLSFVYPGFYCYRFNPVHSPSVSVGGMAFFSFSFFHLEKRSGCTISFSCLVPRIHSCYTGFLFFSILSGSWLSVFIFIFLTGFMGKSSFFAFYKYFGIFFFFLRIHLHIGVHLKKSLACIWEWIGKKITGLGGIVFDF